MEAMTTVTAGLIDRGLEDYMLETAMLKVWSTERLWTIVNDAFQIHGGAAYFTDRPLERMLRDHRINQIGEGANEVLLSFIGAGGDARPGAAAEGSGRRAQAPVERARHDRPLRSGCRPPAVQRAAGAGSIAGIEARGAAARASSSAASGTAVQAHADSPPRGSRRTAARAGADRLAGDGAVRRGLRAQPLGR